MTMHMPPHPGLLVRNELEDIGMTVAAAAKSLGVTRQALYNVMNGKTAISPDMAVRLANGLGSTAETWLKMQALHDLSHVSDAAKSVNRLVATA